MTGRDAILDAFDRLFAAAATKLDVTLTPEDRAKVLWQNAARLYNDGQLPPPPESVEAVKDLEAWNKVHWSE